MGMNSVLKRLSKIRRHEMSIRRCLIETRVSSLLRKLVTSCNCPIIIQLYIIMKLRELREIRESKRRRSSPNLKSKSSDLGGVKEEFLGR